VNFYSAPFLFYTLSGCYSSHSSHHQHKNKGELLRARPGFSKGVLCYGLAMPAHDSSNIVRIRLFKQGVRDRKKGWLFQAEICNKEKQERKITAQIQTCPII